MVENLPRDLPIGRSEPARAGAALGSKAGPPDAQRGSGPEFQALLERIEARARELAEQSRSIQAPGELAGAVDVARQSLEEVLSLKERLLEAYREARRQEASS